MKGTYSLLFCAVAFGLAISAVCTGKTITVNAAGGADFTSIQAAIADSGTVDYDQIEVAPGTYYEAIDFLGKAVRLYSTGGPEVTAIDGTGYDYVVQCINIEGPDTALDGFTITGGGGMYNSGSSPTVTNCIFSENVTEDHGGGMSNVLYSSPIVSHCTFSCNSAIHGGGMYNRFSDSTLTDCTFVGNSAEEGGGMYNYGGNLTLTNCTFLGNSADSGGGMHNHGSEPTITACTFSENIGGGIYNYNSSLTVTGCTFSGNSVIGSGGGMYNFYGRPTITNCLFSENIGGGMCNYSSSPFITGSTFSGNSADTGGGMSNRSSSGAVVAQCTFIDNSANSGGGMFNEDNSSPFVCNCTFSGNSAAYGGGMYNCRGGSPIITGCLFIENSSETKGGGMYNDRISPTVSQCTIRGNSADYGGGMYNTGSSPTVTNCIFWGNTAASGGHEIYNVGNSIPGIRYCDIAGSGGSSSWIPDLGTDGGGNIDANPRFADPNGPDGITGSEDDNLRLSPGSPCIDAGDNAAVPEGITTDLDGNPRILDGNGDGSTIVDMGAYEIPFHPIHNFTKDLFYLEIQAAIDEADAGDQIEVAPGTYYEAINFLGKAVRLYSSSEPNETIIDGTGHDHVVQCISGEDPNTILEGFTLTGANANGPEYDDKCGGGMVNSGSSPTVTGCIFTGNSALLYGGGMYNSYSHPTVTNCIFRENSASIGGGMENYGSRPTIIACTFSKNHTVGRCIGGGMDNWDGHPTVINCIFSDNAADAGGGGMNNSPGNPIVINCTFSGNSALSGGGMNNSTNSKPIIRNCIFWGNTATYGPQLYVSAGSTLTVMYCTIQDGTGQSWFGTGCIDADPLFVDPDGMDGIVGTLDDNFRLSPGSPCIDAGNNSASPPWIVIETDLNSWPRFINDLCTLDTGVGTAPIVDMGAYEFLPADRNGSGLVNLPDYHVLAADWLQTGPGLTGDLNCDGTVDLADLAEQVAYWLEGT